MATGDGRLDGKVAIVTGGGSRGEGIGNGRATAVLLARHGARVTVLDQVEAWAERTAAMIRDKGGASSCPSTPAFRPPPRRRPTARRSGD